MKATMTVFLPADSSEESECELIIRGTEIVVSYNDDDVGRVIYRGHEVSENIWLLSSAEVSGRATLFHSPIFRGTFDGSWIEENYHGMWKIEVEEPEDLKSRFSNPDQQPTPDSIADDRKVRRLFARGKRDGYVMTTDILEAFADWDIDEEKLEDIFEALRSLGIRIED